MRTLAILIVVAACAAPAVAQEVDTVLGPDTESYFYAAAVAKLSEVDSEFATYLGFNLGWVFDEKFSLGVGIYGLAHPTSRRNVGYGGLLFEGFVSGTSSVHFGVRALVGGGYTEPDHGGRHGHRDYHGDDHGDDHGRDGRSFFVAEPELLLRINLSQSLRISLSGGYRFVEGGGRSNDEALSAATGSLAFAIRF